MSQNILFEQREAELRAREEALLKREAKFNSELRFPPFPKDLHWLVRSAPSPWHLQSLALEIIKHLQRSCKQESSPSIPHVDWLGSPQYALARLAAQFNKSLTTKSTPPWLLEMKMHTGFKQGWKLRQRTKGAHKSERGAKRVIEVTSGTDEKLRAEFGKTIVKFQRIRDGVVIETFERERMPSQTVLSTWVGGVIREFDESIDYGGSSLRQDWATRWSDEESYLKLFMPFAKQQWNQTTIDEIQVLGLWGPGLLTANNGKEDGKPRSDFAAFATRIRHLAKHVLRTWRDTISGPAPNT